MTRTARSARLSRHMAEPFLEIHPDDAARLGLAPATLARVRSPHGQAILRVLVSAAVSRGHPFAPIHWTGETAPTGRVDAVVAPCTDPVSGQPESKAAAVAIEPFPATWYAFAVSRQRPRPTSDYWAVARDDAGWRTELAGRYASPDWAAFAADLFGRSGTPVVVEDTARGLARVAFDTAGRLDAALFVSAGPVAVSRAHAAAALGTEAPDPLAGRPGGGAFDPGPIVCSCAGVGRNVILAAAMDGAMDVGAVGAATGAGTTCGSCRTEIAALIAACRTPKAAE